MKVNGYPDRRYAKAPTTTHAPAGKFSLCGAHFAPESLDGCYPVVTCKRCLRAMNRLVHDLQTKEKKIIMRLWTHEHPENSL